VVELEAEVRAALVRLALTSCVRGRLMLPATSHGKPDSMPPASVEHPVERLVVEAERALGDVEALGRGLVAVRAELGLILRRDLAPNLEVDSLEDLAELIVSRGAGWTAREVAISLRCTPTMVRRVRLAHGLELERGRRLELSGHGAELGLELVSAGMSYRAAAVVPGVARSTLSDRVRRQARP
jgi:hypothetical protein